jgi:hypothetical protein
MTSGACPSPITCDFNNGLCGFMTIIPDQMTSSSWQWDLGQGRVGVPSSLVKNQLVLSDRTSPSQGMFLYSDYTQATSLAMMKVISELVEPTTGSCLIFYYLVRTLNAPNSFEIYKTDAQNSGNNSVLLWSYKKEQDPNAKLDPKSQVWIKQQVNIVSRTAFRVALQSTSNDKATYFGIDDLVYDLRACNAIPVTTTLKLPITTTIKKQATTTKIALTTTKKTSVTTTKKISTTITKISTTTKKPTDALNCNFDQGNFCGWTNKPETPFRMSNSTNHVSNLMPNFDKSTGTSQGRYIYVMMPGSSRGYITIIDQLVPNYRGPICIQFWYYMRIDPRSSGTLYVTLNKYIYLKTITYDQGERWRFANIDNSRNSGQEIAIYAIIQSSKKEYTVITIFKN